MPIWSKCQPCDLVFYVVSRDGDAPSQCPTCREAVETRSRFAVT